jgi:hypothetical protein
MVDFIKASDPGVEVRKALDYPERSGVSAPSIQASIDKALAQLKGDEKGAVVAHVDSYKNLYLSTFGKVGDHWSYVMTAEYQPTNKNWRGDAALKFAW